MKILLDECVPWPMHSLLSEHSVTNAQARGWSGIRNSELLGRAEVEFDLFVTSDQSIRYQQNLAGYSIAVLELSTNDLRRIRLSAALIEQAVANIKPGELRRLEIPT